jgi:hypothetical protein
LCGQDAGIFAMPPENNINIQQNLLSCDIFLLFMLFFVPPDLFANLSRELCVAFLTVQGHSFIGEKVKEWKVTAPMLSQEYRIQTLLI